MEMLTVLVSLIALSYCAYQIRKLKADVALLAQSGKIFLDYIVEQRGGLLHLVIDALEAGGNPPAQASDLEIKVARMISRFPANLSEMAAIQNWQPRSEQARP